MWTNAIFHWQIFVKNRHWPIVSKNLPMENGIIKGQNGNFHVFYCWEAVVSLLKRYTEWFLVDSVQFTDKVIRRNWLVADFLVRILAIWNLFARFQTRFFCPWETEEQREIEETMWPVGEPFQDEMIPWKHFEIYIGWLGRIFHHQASYIPLQI